VSASPARGPLAGDGVRVPQPLAHGHQTPGRRRPAVPAVMRPYVTGRPKPAG
jgi:hypothetical protein